MNHYKSELTTIEITTLMTFNTVLNDIERIINGNVTDDEKEQLLKIKDGMKNYYKLVLQRINNDSKERLKSKNENYTVKLDAKNSNKHQRVTLIEDDFYDLACETLDACCKGCDGKRKKCSIRSALHSAFIPDINSPSENKPCGYMYKQEEVNFKRK